MASERSSREFAFVTFLTLLSFNDVYSVLFSVIIAAAMLNSIAPNMVTFTRATTAASELFALIDRPSNIDPFDCSGNKPQTLNGSIEIREISFSYPTRPDVTVLDNYSLRVPAGKVTALVVSFPGSRR
jgi:ATP-binding cassette subfamily B (MDR/TAP) protein 1